MREWVLHYQSVPNTPVLADPVELYNDWEYVISASELLSYQQSGKESKAIQDELRQLREQGQWLKTKRVFWEEAQRILERLSAEDAFELQYSLDASKVNSIVSDSIDQMSDGWLTWISEHVFPSKEQELALALFASSYPEHKPYEKNLIGAAKEMVSIVP